MKLRAYSIYDSKAEAYSQPFYNGTDAMAVRQFSELVNNPEHPFGKHPQDYTLFLVAVFDDQDAKTEPLNPMSLGNGVELTKQMSLPLEE